MQMNMQGFAFIAGAVVVGVLFAGWVLHFGEDVPGIEQAGEGFGN